MLGIRHSLRLRGTLVGAVVPTPACRSGISGERPMGVASGTAAAAVWAGGGGGVVSAALAMPSRPPGLMVTPAGSGGLPYDGAAGSALGRGVSDFSGS